VSTFFLSIEDVLAIHSVQLAHFGGRPGVRDLAALESAVAQAQAGLGAQLFHRDVFEQAAAYAFHISQNQPFVDGNKRTALVAASVFLDLNEIELAESDDLHDAMIAIAEKRRDKLGLADIFKKLSSPRQPSAT
jgi:death on curing protein